MQKYLVEYGLHVSFCIQFKSSITSCYTTFLLLLLFLKFMFSKIFLILIKEDDKDMYNLYLVAHPIILCRTLYMQYN